jgi:hypothetical protein
MPGAEEMAGAARVTHYEALDGDPDALTAVAVAAGESGQKRR